MKKKNVTVGQYKYFKSKCNNKSLRSKMRFLAKFDDNLKMYGGKQLLY